MSIQTETSQSADRTAPEDRVRFQEKLSYGAGNLATMIGKQAPKNFSYQVYNIELGVINPIMIGNIIFASRLVDAVTDPLMGDISDKAKTRWGRRRPFIALGSILSAIAFAMLWLVPRGWSDAAYLAYFGTLSILFYVALTVYTVPWYALGYELTPDYHERTRVMAFPSFFGPIAAVLVGWMYKATYLDIFEDRIEAIRWVGTGGAALILATGLLSSIFTQERYSKSSNKKKSPKETENSSFFTNLKQALGCQPFRMLAYTITLILLGMSMVGSLGSYVTIYYLYGGEKETAATLLGWTGTVAAVSTLIAIPFVTKLATKLGKKQVLVGSLIVAFIGSLGKLVLYTPSAPYLSLLVQCMLAPAGASIFMLLHSMVADVCDLDEYTYSHRREGLFGAVYAWLFKTGISIAFLLSGYIIVSTGFDQSLGGNQSPETLWYLRALFAIVPAIAFGFGLFFLSLYGINEERAKEIRTALEERRGKL